MSRAGFGRQSWTTSHASTHSTAVRRQRWSPLNAHYLGSRWSGAVDTSCRLVDSDIEFRSWGILEVDDLTIWLRRQGFVGTQPGNHIEARAQDFIMHEATRANATVALLEVVFVAVVFHVANRMGPSVARPGLTTNRTLGARSQPPEQLDFMHVEDLFLMKIPMLRSCPKFLRGRLREGFACALRERFRAKQVGDEVGERRAWKLFALIPLMLLHQTRSTGSRRVDLFNNGQWSELVNDVVAQQCRESQANQSAQEDDQVKRGMAAQSKIQRGRVSRARQALTGAELAPKTEETFQLLQGRCPQAAISDEAMQFTPEHPVQLKAKLSPNV